MMMMWLCQIALLYILVIYTTYKGKMTRKGMLSHIVAPAMLIILNVATVASKIGYARGLVVLGEEIVKVKNQLK